MFINATGADYIGFNPANAGLALPPVGVYRNIKLQIANIVEGQTKGDPATGKAPMGKVDITFDIQSGELDGTQFKLTYNTGHHDPKTSVIAVKGVVSLVYAITGIDYTNKQFTFVKQMCNKPFTGTLEVTNQATLDSQGNPYRNGNLKALKMFDWTAAPAPAHNVPQAIHATPQHSATIAQPDGGRPAWAGPQA